MSANTEQVGGSHYKKYGDVQPWDLIALFNLDAHQFEVINYVIRHKDKGGVQDLEKAAHWLRKYIETQAPQMKIKRADLPTEIFPLTMNDSGSPNHKPKQPLPQHPPQHPQAIAYGSEVMPTGWVGFMFDGTDAEGAAFKCKACNARFRTPAGANPHRYHTCEVKP